MNELTKEMDRWLNAFDLIGFDPHLRRLQGIDPTTKSPSFPPYNLIQDGENIRIEIAVAGYSTDEIDIEYHDGVLTVQGNKEDFEDNSKYIYKGIAERNFIRKFTLADTVVVDNATFDNGILTIHMHNELPEHLKQRKIEIENASKKQLLNE